MRLLAAALTSAGSFEAHPSDGGFFQAALKRLKPPPLPEITRSPACCSFITWWGTSCCVQEPPEVPALLFLLAANRIAVLAGHVPRRSKQIKAVLGAARVNLNAVTLSRSITTSYYRNSVGGLLVFDLTNRKTFDHVREWHKEVSEHILPHHMVYILIGHKSDLNKDRKVSRDEAEQLAADLGVRYVETSAKCNSNVDRAFELLTRDIYELMKMGEIVTRDGWDGVKSGLTAKVLYPAEDEEEVAMATAEKGCHC